MAYVKTNWQTGDVITAVKLNNMETGIYDATEAAANAFVADIDSPQDGDVIKYDGTAEKWVNGAASGGGTPVIPEITVGRDESDNNTYSCNMTFSQVSAAVASGNCFFLKELASDGAYQLFVLSSFSPDYEIMFSFLAVYGTNDAQEMSYVYSSDGTIEKFEK